MLILMLTLMLMLNLTTAHHVAMLSLITLTDSIKGHPKLEHVPIIHHPLIHLTLITMGEDASHLGTPRRLRRAAAGFSRLRLVS